MISSPVHCSDKSGRRCNRHYCLSSIFHYSIIKINLTKVPRFNVNTHIYAVHKTAVSSTEETNKSIFSCNLQHSSSSSTYCCCSSTLYCCDTPGIHIHRYVGRSLPPSLVGLPWIHGIYYTWYTRYQVCTRYIPGMYGG